MKNLKSIVCVLITLISGVVHGQLGNLLASDKLVADKQFDEFAYVDALDSYLKAYDKDTSSMEVKWKIAECYRFLNNPPKAEEWYGKIVDVEGVVPTALYHYAEALKSNRKYEKAMEWFKKYDMRVEEDQRISHKINAIRDRGNLINKADLVEVTSVSFNGKNSDFAPTYYQEGIVFVSARQKSLLHKKYSWDNSFFVDLHYASFSNGDSHLEFNAPKPFVNRLNSSLHDGPISFYDNENKAVLTRNNINRGKQERSSDETNHLQLFLTEKVDSEWQELEPFEFNNKEYSLGHATITDDGMTMIFVSDMPNGFGKSDLYVTRQVGNSWTAPENLGGSINTRGDEMFPFLIDSTLYFASNGHGGLGGLDLFKVDLRDLTTVINMGAPFNSSLDDFGLIKKGKEGYFSSNREGNDDIYYFKDNRFDSLMVNILVKNESDSAFIPFAEIQINDSLSFITGEYGVATVKLPADQFFKFTALKEDFVSVNTVNVKIDNYFEGPIELFLKPEGLFVRIMAVDSETSEIILDPLVKLKNITTGEDIEPLLIQEKSTLFPLDKQSNFQLTGAKSEYFTSHSYESTKNEKGELNWVIALDKIVLNKEVTLDNIYYDLDKATLRFESKVELDKLVSILKDNPAIKIELSSHTDARGNDDYNLNLSQRRAETAVNYVISKGIDSERVIAKGYGETKLVNACDNNSSCSEDEHQANRRTEFKVIAIKEGITKR